MVNPRHVFGIAVFRPLLWHRFVYVSAAVDIAKVSASRKREEDQQKEMDDIHQYIKKLVNKSYLRSHTYILKIFKESWQKLWRRNIFSILQIIISRMVVPTCTWCLFKYLWRIKEISFIFNIINYCSKYMLCACFCLFYRYLLANTLNLQANVL